MTSDESQCNSPLCGLLALLVLPLLSLLPLFYVGLPRLLVGGLVAGAAVLAVLAALTVVRARRRAVACPPPAEWTQTRSR